MQWDRACNGGYPRAAWDFGKSAAENSDKSHRSSSQFAVWWFSCAALTSYIHVAEKLGCGLVFVLMTGSWSERLCPRFVEATGCNIVKCKTQRTFYLHCRGLDISKHLFGATCSLNIFGPPWCLSLSISSPKTQSYFKPAAQLSCWCSLFLATIPIFQSTFVSSVFSAVRLTRSLEWIVKQENKMSTLTGRREITTAGSVTTCQRPISQMAWSQSSEGSSATLKRRLAAAARYVYSYWRQSHLIKAPADWRPTFDQGRLWISWWNVQTKMHDMTSSLRLVGSNLFPFWQKLSIWSAISGAARLRPWFRSADFALARDWSGTDYRPQEFRRR